MVEVATHVCRLAAHGFAHIKAEAIDASSIVFAAPCSSLQMQTSIPLCPLTETKVGSPPFKIQNLGNRLRSSFSGS